MHPLRQAADVVVRFDRSFTAKYHGFNHIGIQRALSEIFHLAELLSLLFENLDKAVADALPFFFRISDALQPLKEIGFRINVNHLQVSALAEETEHALALVGAHQAVVDMNAGELAADGPVDHRGDHRGIHAAGQGADHPVAADFGPHRFHC